MLKLNKRLENIGELLRSNIRYDNEEKVDKFSFIRTKIHKDNVLKAQVDKSINRKITRDDTL